MAEQQGEEENGDLKVEEIECRLQRCFCISTASGRQRYTYVCMYAL
jgi:hypothetical protein